MRRLTGAELETVKPLLISGTSAFNIIHFVYQSYGKRLNAQDVFNMRHKVCSQVNLVIDNDFPVQAGQTDVRKSIIDLARRMSDEQRTALYNYAHQLLHSGIPSTSLTLSTATMFPVDAHQQDNVDLVAALSNDDEEVISINSEEFTERDYEEDERAHNDRQCDICYLAQPPSEVADGGSAWIFCPCSSMYHSFCAYDPSQVSPGFNCPMCGAVSDS
ncbi:unnamed protein product [Schistosoma rodhaini]|nr:unnamed protein product [Schistosoma rodhaini]